MPFFFTLGAGGPRGQVRGRGECPDPAAGYPAGGWAELASASSPAPASSCTAIVSFSRGQAFYGYLTHRLAAPARRRTPPRCAPASRKLFGRTTRAQQLVIWTSRVSPTSLHKGKRRLTSKGQCKPVQAFQREAGEGWFEHANDCDSPLGATYRGMRCWPSLVLQTRAPEAPF